MTLQAGLVTYICYKCFGMKFILIFLLFNSTSLFAQKILENHKGKENQVTPSANHKPLFSEYSIDSIDINIVSNGVVITNQRKITKLKDKLKFIIGENGYKFTNQANRDRITDTPDKGKFLARTSFCDICPGYDSFSLELTSFKGETYMADLSKRQNGWALTVRLKIGAEDHSTVYYLSATE